MLRSFDKAKPRKISLRDARRRRRRAALTVNSRDRFVFHNRDLLLAKHAVVDIFGCPYVYGAQEEERLVSSRLRVRYFLR